MHACRRGTDAEPLRDGRRRHWKMWPRSFILQNVTLKQSVKILNDGRHQLVVRSVEPKNGVQKCSVAEIREDVIDAVQRLLRQMARNEPLEQFTGVRQGVHQIRGVVSEVHLKHKHSSNVNSVFRTPTRRTELGYSHSRRTSGFYPVYKWTGQDLRHNQNLQCSVSLSVRRITMRFTLSVSSQPYRFRARVSQRTTVVIGISS